MENWRWATLEVRGRGGPGPAHGRLPGKRELGGRRGVWGWAAGVPGGEGVGTASCTRVW